MASEGRLIRVALADKPYDVHVRPGLLADAGAVLARVTSSRRAMIVSDDNVGPLYSPTLCLTCGAAGMKVAATCSLPPGEDHKDLETISHLYDVLLDAKIDRDTVVFALGGGVIGDMVGFAAATVLRGVPFVQVPTTLLAMVDASVGGKTGVNHRVGKNLIGAFHQPIAVLIDPQVLRTLPPRELRSGLAECIKHDIIRDAEGFARLEQNIERALQLDTNYLAELIAHNVAIKARVVEADPFERGERAHLNFGHTFGHAIETVSHYAYAHGECIALGMVAAAGAARELEMIDDDTRRRIVAVIQSAGLPVSGMTLGAQDVIDAMEFDKKVKAGRVRFVLPDRIGHVVVRDDVPPEVVRRAVEGLRG